MALGPRDTTSLVALTGWDTGELAKFALQDGTSYAQIVSEMNTALGALNAELYGDPLWASLVSYTDELTVEYRVGNSNGFELHSEYGRPDPKRAATDGHMLPLVAYDRALDWTWDYLRRARLPQVRADIADAIKDARDRWRLSILTRLLARSDESGAAKGLGAAGYSPGFATTAASTNVDFVPPSYGGTSFLNTHEHYYTVAGGLFTATVFSDAKEELREHGHEPPYEFIIGPTDEATVRGLSGFVPVAQSYIQYANTVSVATLNGTADSNGNYIIGTLNDFAVRVVRGIPQYYGFAWKSYGPRSQRNPLRIRLQKGEMRPRVIAMPDPRAGSNGAYPLNYLMLFTEFGVGVADRTNGTPRYVNHANTWADGTPT